MSTKITKQFKGIKMDNPFLNFKVKRKFAGFISSVTHPPVVAIAAFIFINYFILDWNKFLFITSICLIFGTFLPIITALFWIKKRKIDIDITNRFERTFPLIYAIISYLIGAAVLYILGSPPATTVLMFCYFSNTLVVLFINHFWKISIHAMGVAGPTAALIYVFGYYGVLFGLIIPFVMWSRVYLKKHSLYQVLAGAAYGLLVTGLQFYLLIPV